MKIDKVINNNVVSAMDDKGEEIIIMGKGIGFQAKKGNIIEENKIEKIFRMESAEIHDRFKTLLKDMPVEHLQISNEIISYAKETLNKKLNQSIYLTLTDHINFAIERKKNDMMFHNALLWEVKTFYRQEFMIGQFAVRLLKRDLGIDFPEDEAASIALHIVNAEYYTEMSSTLKSTRMIPEILHIIKEFFNIELDDTSLYYEQFIVHLKFLIQRVLTKEIFKEKDVQFTQTVEQLYGKEYECSQKIAQYIFTAYNSTIGENEIANLAIQIKNLKEFKR